MSGEIFSPGDGWALEQTPQGNDSSMKSGKGFGQSSQVCAVTLGEDL